MTPNNSYVFCTFAVYNVKYRYLYIAVSNLFLWRSVNIILLKIVVAVQKMLYKYSIRTFIVLIDKLNCMSKYNIIYLVRVTVLVRIKHHSRPFKF